MKKNNIVTIWWGTGSYVLLSWLKALNNDNISSIVSVTDEGWSTWFLKDQYGILPPGDIRQVLIALSNENQELLRRLFNFRFSGWDFHWHNFWNLFLTAMEQVTWDFQQAIQKMWELLWTTGNVLPVTLDKPRLKAKLKNWKEIIGEESFDKMKNSEYIKEVSLNKKVKLNPEAKKAIKEADFIIIWPWSLYTSIITNLLTWDIKEELINSKAKKILISNIMNNKTDTNNFKAVDFLDEIESYIQKDFFDNIILPINNLTKDQILRYQKEEKYFMSYSLEDFKDKKAEPIISDIIDNHEVKKSKEDLVPSRSLLRYNSEKLAKIIISKIIWNI